MPPQNAGFTGVSGDDLPGTSGLGSFASSLANEFSQTTGTSVTQTESASFPTTTSGSSTIGLASGSAAETSATTFTTSVSSSGGAGAGSSSDSHVSSTASNAASNTSGAVTVSEKSCDSLSCSPGLQAAVAVPIVVAAIAAIFFFLFCAKRRRRGGAVMSEKKPKKSGKKWTRHLRAFSFDAELLMGGRFSSSNSLRSRDPSVRSAGVASRNSAHATEPSLHSIEEVAPPYRDAMSHAQPPSPTHPRPGPPVTTIAGDSIPRPSSTATAPPPYRSVVGEPRVQASTPTSARDPFADSAPVSPIEGSPFNDPIEDEETHTGGLVPALSRGSSMYRSVNSDDDATPTASEAGSIRQAVLGRRVSVKNTQNASGGSS